MATKCAVYDRLRGACHDRRHTYASPRGHALIDRELYLPAAWAEDEERRLLRHVPDEVTFATKPQLAAAMLHRARRLGLPARWFTGDEVYGSLKLRHTARTLGFDYALAVRADHRASTAAGRFSATELAAKVPARAWMRRRTGNGTKGDRHYDWTLIDILADDAPAGRDEAGHAFLVVRRHRYTREIREQGCTGSLNLLYKYVTPGRIEGERPVTTPQRFTRLLLSRPENLPDKDAAFLREPTSSCPELGELARLTGEFAQLLPPGRGQRRQAHRVDRPGPCH